MTVYVDPLFATRKSSRWKYPRACHMMADSPQELEEMARKLNLPAIYVQQPGTPLAHYDLTPNKRAKALELGAQEITAREMVSRMMELHQIMEDVLAVGRESLGL